MQIPVVGLVLQLGASQRQFREIGNLLRVRLLRRRVLTARSSDLS